MTLNFEIKELTKELLISTKGFYESLANMRKVGDLKYDKAIEILKKINNQDGHIFVAISNNNEIIGTTTVLIEQKFIREGAKVCHIEDVSTRKGYEGKGVSSSIITRAINFAKEKNCYKIILDCSEELTSYYSKFGFILNEKHMRLDL